MCLVTLGPMVVCQVLILFNVCQLQHGTSTPTWPERKPHRLPFERTDARG